MSSLVFSISRTPIDANTLENKQEHSAGDWGLKECMYAYMTLVWSRTFSHIKLYEEIVHGPDDFSMRETIGRLIGKNGRMLDFFRTSRDCMDIGMKFRLILYRDTTGNVYLMSPIRLSPEKIEEIESEWNDYNNEFLDKISNRYSFVNNIRCKNRIDCMREAVFSMIPARLVTSGWKRLG